MKGVFMLGVVVLLVSLAVVWTVYFSGGFIERMAIPEPGDSGSSAAKGEATQGGQIDQMIRKVTKGPLAPEIASTTWLNSPALTSADLRDHVVVVEFWTFG